MPKGANTAVMRGLICGGAYSIYRDEQGIILFNIWHEEDDAMRNIMPDAQLIVDEDDLVKLIYDINAILGSNQRIGYFRKYRQDHAHGDQPKER